MHDFITLIFHCNDISNCTEFRRSDTDRAECRWNINENIPEEALCHSNDFFKWSNFYLITETGIFGTSEKIDIIIDRLKIILESNRTEEVSIADSLNDSRFGLNVE